MVRRVLAWPFAPQRRTLTVLLVILVAAMFIATGTGFWLLYRIAYIVAMGIPVALVIAWLNTRALDVDVDRRTLRGQVGQVAEELIEVRNPQPHPEALGGAGRPERPSRTRFAAGRGHPQPGAAELDSEHHVATARPLRLGPAARARGGSLRHLLRRAQLRGAPAGAGVPPRYPTCPASRHRPRAFLGRGVSAAARTTSRRTPAAPANTPRAIR